ncbi:MAG: methyltransferase domain-containing protein [Bdellovibrionaceae bacterium]|nr:methyltransferase domain-containing protein [Pseudobdellovibrionaceae bacterium]
MHLHESLIRAVIEALQNVFQRGLYSDKVLNHLFRSHPKWGARDRRFVAEAVYEGVRHFLKFAYLAGKDVTPEPHLSFYFMLWQVQFLMGSQNPEQAFAELRLFLKKSRLPFSNEHILSFTAFKRRLDRLQDQPEWIQHSWPQWLDQYLQEQLGKKWTLLRQILNEPAPVDLRVHRQRTSREQLQQSLLREGIITEPIEGLSWGLTLKERKNVFVTEAFRRGDFEVQDRASQRVVEFLDPRPGERICDGCAGAGGKTLHIADLMGNRGKIVALDIHDYKLEELKKRARRHGISIVETRVVDSTKVIKRLFQSFDRVLLDVPCSGLGVVRRNPDTKWKLTQERIFELQELQRKILGMYSEMVKPGGRLVYSTCSILPSENEKQIAWLLGEQSGRWKYLGQWVHDPGPTGDGFFVAQLERIR